MRPEGRANLPSLNMQVAPICPRSCRLQAHDQVGPEAFGTEDNFFRIGLRLVKCCSQLCSQLEDSDPPPPGFLGQRYHSFGVRRLCRSWLVLCTRFGPSPYCTRSRRNPTAYDKWLLGKVQFAVLGLRMPTGSQLPLLKANSHCAIGF